MTQLVFCKRILAGVIEGYGIQDFLRFKCENHSGTRVFKA